jgi:hypothetical protein
MIRLYAFHKDRDTFAKGIFSTKDFAIREIIKNKWNGCLTEYYIDKPITSSELPEHWHFNFDDTRVID